MGRVSYEGMAPYWQASTEPIATPMNEIPKAVFSTTLGEATWPNTTIYRDIECGIEELRGKTAGRSSPMPAQRSRSTSRASI